jgi:hypothetical protein
MRRIHLPETPEEPPSNPSSFVGGEKRTISLRGKQMVRFTHPTEEIESRRFRMRAGANTSPTSENELYLRLFITHGGGW